MKWIELEALQLLVLDSATIRTKELGRGQYVSMSTAVRTVWRVQEVHGIVQVAEVVRWPGAVFADRDRLK
jgi:hypothetical protein